MAPILNRTPLAAISYQDDNGDHIRVFYQDMDGYIRQSFYDTGKGWNERKNDIVGKAKLNTGIAAITWNNGKEIRVYFIGPENTIVERGSSGNNTWYYGPLTKENHKAAPYSKVAAVGYHAKSPAIMRIYFQDRSNKIIELVQRGDDFASWEKRSEFPTASPGTGLAVTPYQGLDASSVYLYYQQASLMPTQLLLDDASAHTKGELAINGYYSLIASLAAVAWDGEETRVVAVSDENKLTLTSIVHGEAHATEPLYPVVIPGSDVAVVRLRSAPAHQRIFFQRYGSIITALGSDDNGETWKILEAGIPVDASSTFAVHGEQMSEW
ncbi:Fucose-specific lectin [Ceratocystis lukuohia]|uniref:Fucose-specific lectin n=2 Tax=Ceratocystis TaxID=5157 RepID=A0A0F8B1M8_CERFI|nr:Fucose-specific lectin [Ceratocystis platani]